MGGTSAPGGAAREGLKPKYWTIGAFLGAARSQPRPRAHSQSAYRTARGVRREGTLRWARPVCPVQWHMLGHARRFLALANCRGAPTATFAWMRRHGAARGRRARSRLLGTSATQQRGAPRSPPARAARNAHGGAICGALWAQALTTRRATPRATWRRTVGGVCRAPRRRRHFLECIYFHVSRICVGAGSPFLKCLANIFQA